MRAATGAIAGTNCSALAPVPTTRTRLPRRSTPWSHSAEWNAGPAKDSRPGRSGTAGRESWPVAVTSTSVVRVSPAVVVSVQLRCSSSYAAEASSTPVRTRSRTPVSRAVRSM